MHISEKAKNTGIAGFNQKTKIAKFPARIRQVFRGPGSDLMESSDSRENFAPCRT